MTVANSIPDADVPASLSDTCVAARLERRTVRGRQFICGPLPMKWFEVAAVLPGKALAVALLVWFRHGFDKSRTEPIPLTPTLLARFGVGRKAGVAARPGWPLLAWCGWRPAAAGVRG